MSLIPGGFVFLVIPAYVTFVARGAFLFVELALPEAECSVEPPVALVRC